jgi:hypothetical protein
MAGYNRDIVATRNLNKRNKARLRSTGDTELGFINGRLSHINKDEKRRLTAADAYDISLRERVEAEIVSEAEGGTINPFTGMKEYHAPAQGQQHDDSGHKAHVMVTKTDDQGVPYQEQDYLQPLFTTEQFAADEELLGTALSGYTEDEQIGYEQYGGLSEVERASYLGKFDITPEKLKFISPLETKPFEFLQQGAALEREQLGATFGKGYEESSAALKQNIVGSGLKSSGAITGGFQQQLQGLTRDYQAGAKAVGLGLEQDIYTEQKRQMDKLWQQIGMVSQK